jgi:hypothetical protein
MFMTIIEKCIKIEIPRSNLVSFGMGLAIVLVMGTTIGMFDFGIETVGLFQVQTAHADSSCGTWYNPSCVDGWYDKTPGQG